MAGAAEGLPVDHRQGFQRRFQGKDKAAAGIAVRMQAGLLAQGRDQKPAAASAPLQGEVAAGRSADLRICIGASEQLRGCCTKPAGILQVDQVTAQAFLGTSNFTGCCTLAAAQDSGQSAHARQRRPPLGRQIAWRYQTTRVLEYQSYGTRRRVPGSAPFWARVASLVVGIAGFRPASGRLIHHRLFSSLSGWRQPAGSNCWSWRPLLLACTGGVIQLSRHHPRQGGRRYPGSDHRPGCLTKRNRDESTTFSAAG